ncbi:helix-turn-helix transcriptional regulator [Sphingobacterium sp.]|uniref:helix-turn-helix domain-containing protein n=1 Tax=Sphingobacterium sp. TaxID=341027 RepID=UPI00289C8E6B|nr:helix-turn-helix transcriptional regulator [Sphingobacterium sp.]
MKKNKHSKIYKAIGTNLKRRRLELDLTQEKLADKIPKMDRSKISDMENGKEDFVFSKLLDLCDALDLTVLDALKVDEE